MACCVPGSKTFSEYFAVTVHGPSAFNAGPSGRSSTRDAAMTGCPESGRRSLALEPRFPVPEPRRAERLLLVAPQRPLDSVGGLVTVPGGGGATPPGARHGNYEVRSPAGTADSSARSVLGQPRTRGVLPIALVILTWRSGRWSRPCSRSWSACWRSRSPDTDRAAGAGHPNVGVRPQPDQYGRPRRRHRLFAPRGDRASARLNRGSAAGSSSGRSRRRGARWSRRASPWSSGWAPSCSPLVDTRRRPGDLVVVAVAVLLTSPSSPPSWPPWATPSTSPDGWPAGWRGTTPPGVGVGPPLTRHP
jgi:hypothetical protein